MPEPPQSAEPAHHAREPHGRLSPIEGRFRSLMLATSQLAWTANAQGDIDTDLGMWQAFTGMSDDAVKDSGWLEAVHPDDRARAMEAWNQAVAARSPYDTEYRLRRHDGCYRWFSVRGVPVLDEAGHPLEWVGFSRDIDDEKQAAQALAQSNARLKILSEASRLFAAATAEPSALLDTIARHIAEVIGGAVSIFLISPDGQRLDNVAVYHPDPVLREFYGAFIEAHPVSLTEGLGGRVIPGGETVFLPVASAERQRAMIKSDYWPVIDRMAVQGLIAIPLKVRGRVIGSLYSLRTGETSRPHTGEDLDLLTDLADRAALAIDSARLIETLEQRVRERTAELEDAYARLKELDRLKSNFVNSVTHELRTPLTSIFGYTEFLEDEIGGPVTPTQQEFVTQIARGARRLEYLLNDLLDFARLEAGTFKLKLEEASFAAKAREVIESLKPQLEEAGLSLEASLADAPLTLRMDPQRVGQVLINLIGNAIKFTPPGGQIRLRAHQEPGWLMCEVSDTGPGIAPEDRPKLFQRFSQLEAGVSTGKGTGLGLSISKALIEAHGGAIGVESEPGKGSTFWFKLPL
ncbi:Signal transduction histidine-protein kinase BarA [compost metagenome]